MSLNHTHLEVDYWIKDSKHPSLLNVDFYSKYGRGYYLLLL